MPGPDEAVRVHSVQEEYFYLMVRRCACGGPWATDSQETHPAEGALRHRVDAHCFKCNVRRTFHFILHAPEGSKEPVRQVNPTAEPSRALDVADWMDLARFYLGRIERLKKPVERAQSLLDARQCIEEALKFYGPGDEDPPPSAMWSDESRKKADRDREALRRDALVAMLAKIPPTDRLRQADKMEQKEFEKAVRAIAKQRRRPWWQFWKRP